MKLTKSFHLFMSCTWKYVRDFPPSDIITNKPQPTCRLHHTEVFSTVWCRLELYCKTQNESRAVAWVWFVKSPMEKLYMLFKKVLQFNVHIIKKL